MCPHIASRSLSHFASGCTEGVEGEFFFITEIQDSKTETASVEISVQNSFSIWFTLILCI